MSRWEGTRWYHVFRPSWHKQQARWDRDRWMNWHHRRAARVLTILIVIDAAFGYAFGLADHVHPVHGMYCALGTATTVGCDIVPANGPAYVISACMMIIVVPLWTAAIAYFTTGLLADHVSEETKKQTGTLREHAEEQARSQTEELKEHGNGNWRYPR